MTWAALALGYRITRTLTRPGGLQARLVAEGTQHAALLQRVQAVQAAQQLRSGPGFEIALQHWLAGSEEAPVLILTQGVLQLPALRLVMKVFGADGCAAEIEVQAPQGDITSLPEDLLAVLGWASARLARSKQGWTSSLR